MPRGLWQREIVQPFAALPAHIGPINVMAAAHQRLRDDSTDAARARHKSVAFPLP
jgi:hypothetical protein